MAETALRMGAGRWFWPGFFALILGAWAGLWLLAEPLPGEGWLAALCRPAAGASGLTLLSMWLLMVLAMMLPGLVPALSTWRDLAATGADTGETEGALLGGYLLVWAAAAIGFAALQMLIGTPEGEAGRWFAAALLIGAGLWQLTPVKAACLSRCRHPLTFFLGHWRPGQGAAFVMGLRLGAVCLGCCWALMALALIGGVMSLAIMAAATVLMSLEKLPEIGRILTPALASGLIFAGGALALGLF